MLQELALCPSPRLLADYITSTDRFDAVVATDILRATTTITEALAAGVSSVIPVESLDELKTYKGKEGYLTAGERGGKKVDFADLGNNPLEYTPQKVKGKTIVLSTTNGTQNLRAISRLAPQVPIYIGAIGNLDILARLLEEKYSHILVAASGWKNCFSFEDSLFAALLVESLCQTPPILDDATQMARDALSLYGDNWKRAVAKSEHYQRLKKLIAQEQIDYCLKEYLYSIVPQYLHGEIRITHKV